MSDARQPLTPPPPRPRVDPGVTTFYPPTYVNPMPVAIVSGGGGGGGGGVINEVLAGDGLTGGGSAVSVTLAMNPATSAGFVTAVGDVTGLLSATTVGRLHGRDISSTAPGPNQVLQWTGAMWAPATVVGAPGGAVNEVQYHTAAGALGGFNMTGDATLALPSGALTLTSVVTAGTFQGIQFNAKGLVIGASNMGYLDQTAGDARYLTPAAAAAIYLTQAAAAATYLTPAAGDLRYLQLATPIALTGDVAGSGPATGIATTVARLQGRNVANVDPADGEVLAWNALSASWGPEPAAVGGGTPGGNVGEVQYHGAGGVFRGFEMTGDATLDTGTGALTLATQAGLTAGSYQGIVVNNKGLVTGAAAIAYLTANQPITLSGDVTSPAAPQALAATVVRLQGRDVNSAAPTDGQILSWDQTNNRWTPATPLSAPPLPLAVDLGGTGAATFVNNALVYGSGTAPLRSSPAWGINPVQGTALTSLWLDDAQLNAGYVEIIRGHAGPAAISNRDLLGGVFLDGYFGSADNENTAETNGCLGVFGIATENWGVGATGASLSFNTTANGTTQPRTRLVLDSAGNARIFGAVQAGLGDLVRNEAGTGNPYLRPAGELLLLTNLAPDAAVPVGAYGNITCFHNTGVGPGLQFVSIRGSSGSATQVLTGDQLGALNFEGANGATTTVRGASIAAVAGANFTALAAGSGIEFWNVPVTPATTVMRRNALLDYFGNHQVYGAVQIVGELHQMGAAPTGAGINSAGQNRGAERLYIQGAQSMIMTAESVANNATGTLFNFKKAQGTWAAKTACAVSNTILRLGAFPAYQAGTGETPYFNVPAAAITFITTEATTVASRGTAIEFGTTTTGTGIFRQEMAICGGVIIGDISVPYPPPLGIGTINLLGGMVVGTPAGANNGYMGIGTINLGGSLYLDGVEVTLGAPSSGGTGLRALVVPN